MTQRKAKQMFNVYDKKDIAMMVLIAVFMLGLLAA
jgi:hypothetical protein